MCGLAGYVGFDERSDSLENLRALLAAQRHRGPDDQGILVHNPRHGHSHLLDRNGTAIPFPRAGETSSSRPDYPTVILGSQRLAILDRTHAGRQPMVSADGRYAILLNGEIYNYVELGRELEAKGHIFGSRTDTEVLLAAFAQWGQECLARLIGMYAFVVHDNAGQRLFLARDPFGIKPLHYARPSGALVFASEISALLRWPGIDRRVHPQALYDYLDGAVIGFDEYTMFDEITSLPPAHYVETGVRDVEAMRPVRYWRPDVDSEAEISFGDATKQMRDLFLESVEMHLRSDVPVGALLSGGTDSSSVVMAMREVGGAALDIHTFSYIGGQGAPSEERWIDIVNEASGAVSHKVELEPPELAADLEQLIQAQGEPFGSLAIYAQSRLFRRAREEGVQVILSGTGGDELIAGYENFHPARLASLLRPASLGMAGRFLYQTARSPRTVAHLVKHSLILTLPPQVYSAIYQLRPCRSWIDTDWIRLRGVRRRTWPVASKRVLPDRLLRRLMYSIPILTRYEDRSGMAYSVEGRVPFLTRRLAEFVLSLPERYLIGDRGQTKHILREAMRGIVPDEILDRRDKIGFAVPLVTWPSLVPGFGDVLEYLRRIPAVNMSAVHPHLKRLRSSGTVTPKMVFPLWHLAGLAGWARHFDVTFD